jgi:hypothetical protein
MSQPLKRSSQNGLNKVSGSESQAPPGEEHELRQSAGATFHLDTLGDTEDYTAFYRYLRLLPFDRRRTHLALVGYTILSFAKVAVHFFSGPSDSLMGHRVNNIQLHHFICEHA